MKGKVRREEWGVVGRVCSSWEQSCSLCQFLVRSESSMVNRRRYPCLVRNDCS